MLWPKKAKDQPKVADGQWVGETADIKKLYLWCDSQEEFDHWIENESPLLWNTMTSTKGENAHDRDSVKSFKQFLTKKAAPSPGAQEPQKPPKVKKKAAAPETAEEAQLRIGLEAEQRRNEALQQRANSRTESWVDTDYTAVVAILNGNDIAKAAWEAIAAHFKSGSSKTEIGGLGVQDHAALTAACAVWRTAAFELQRRGQLGLVTWMSRFNEVKDKSKRTDGGKNAANLVARSYQASFIAEIQGIGRINLHVDSNPPA